MASINLLPTDLVRNHEAAKITKILKGASMFLGTATLVLGFVMGGYFFYKDKSLRDSKAKYESYKNQVLALESTESSLVLVRDRLTKISQIYTKYPYTKNVIFQNTLLKELPEGVTLNLVAGNTQSQKLTFTAKDSSSLKQLVDIFEKANLFGTVELKNLGYNPENGFQIAVEFTNI